MTERSTPHNSTLAIAGVSSPLDSFVAAESSVLRTILDSYRDAEKSAHRQTAKRQTPLRAQTSCAKTSFSHLIPGRHFKRNRVRHNASLDKSSPLNMAYLEGYDRHRLLFFSSVLTSLFRMCPTCGLWIR